MDPLTYTVPDEPLIDGVRGFLGLFLVFLGADIYITATELEQIGHRMLMWRLPLGLLVIVGALVYIARLSLAVANRTVT